MSALDARNVVCSETPDLICDIYVSYILISSQVKQGFPKLYQLARKRVPQNARTLLTTSCLQNWAQTGKNYLTFGQSLERRTNCFITLWIGIINTS